MAKLNYIPKEILAAAEGRKELGGRLVKAGSHKGRDVYTYEYDEPMTIGLPELYLWNGSRCEVMEGEEALALLATFA